jgi:hypothetical protein
MAWVRERTIPTERPPFVGEVSANFCDNGCHVFSVADPYGRIGFLDRRIILTLSLFLLIIFHNCTCLIMKTIVFNMNPLCPHKSWRYVTYSILKVSKY